ncbi:hypothetical protein HMPREF1531_01129 [Propionibacterium sp. oral taxon 192 str. F0372]|nr:hypothetical protein [Propionibacterium sp. oral taxon 192]EPH04414.1 hypothetical protein HMPREF1531_01129 [Propionibacterium sp. oral taxon 192 str. F0372]
MGTDPRRAPASFWTRIGLVQQNWTDHPKWRVKDQLGWIRSIQLTADDNVSTVEEVLECVPFIILSSLAAAPLGIAAACAARGMYSLMVTLLPIMALVATSGAFFPVVALPRWVQLIHLALPTYWSGHLTRWALVGDPSWEIGGAFRPKAALTVLVTWTVVGLRLLAPTLVRRSFRRESIGNLARMQSATRSQTGM